MWPALPQLAHPWVEARGRCRWRESAARRGGYIAIKSGPLNADRHGPRCARVGFGGAGEHELALVIHLTAAKADRHKYVLQVGDDITGGHGFPKKPGPGANIGVVIARHLARVIGYSAAAIAMVGQPP